MVGDSERLLKMIYLSLFYIYRSCATYPLLFILVHNITISVIEWQRDLLRLQLGKPTNLRIYT